MDEVDSVSENAIVAGPRRTRGSDRSLVKHGEFFESLGSMDEDSPEWRSQLAALLTLRIIDRLNEGAGVTEADRVRASESVSAMVGGLPEGHPTRATLLRLITAVRGSSADSSEVAQSAIAYGKALDLTARWSLAADVFRTVAEAYDELDGQRITIESLILLGAAARNLGAWDESESSYARAQYLADARGYTDLGLTAQVGIANNHIARGNLPAADAELAEVLDEVRGGRRPFVEAIALHGCAYLAITRGAFQEAIHHAYRSLELTTDLTARDRILADIAAAYAGLGQRDVARDGYSIVALTSPHQWVRWQALLNLLELDVDEGSEGLFDEHLAQVEHQPLDPRLSAFALIQKARGFRRFGREGYEKMFAAAGELASTHKLHQLAFQAEHELSVEHEPLDSAEDLTDGVRKIAESVRKLRDQVGTSGR